MGGAVVEHESLTDGVVVEHLGEQVVGQWLGLKVREGVPLSGGGVGVG